MKDFKNYVLDHKKTPNLEVFKKLEVSSELHNVLAHRYLCLYERESNKMVTKRLIYVFSIPIKMKLVYEFIR